MATARVHASLHEHPAFVALLEGRATLDLYRRLLSRLYGVYRPLEATLMAARHHLPPDLATGRRSRTALMASDLMALGLGADDLARLPSKRGVRPLTSRGEALGALYVMQGSALGGKVIARALAGRVPDAACRYFAGLADDREAWQRCCDALEEGACDVAQLTAAAAATFQHIADWFAGWPEEDRAHG